MKPKQLKAIPEFKNENEEFEFWSTHDSTEYLDWTKAEEAIFPNLRPSSETISLRLPRYLLERIKQKANSSGMPYQSLMKYFLTKAIDDSLAEPLQFADKGPRYTAKKRKK